MDARTSRLWPSSQTVVWLSTIATLIWFSSPQSLIPVAAWLAPLAIVRWLRQHGPFRGFLVIWLVMSAVNSVANFGFVPLPLIGHLIFTPIASLIAMLPYLADRLVAPRLRSFAATLVLPLAWTSLDYAQTFFFSATIMSPAYTQAALLPLIQIAAVTGVWGVTFLLFWFGSLANWLWEQLEAPGRDQVKLRRGIVIYAATMLAVLGFGVARLALANVPSETVQVAAISVNQLGVATTAYTALSGQQLTLSPDIAAADPQVVQAQLALGEFFQHPDRPQFAPVHAELHALYDKLFSLTRREARAGAKIVVWSEANAMVSKPYEATLLRRAQEVAREEGIYLYLTLATFQPGVAPFTSGGQTMENKVVAIGPHGTLLSTYYKTKLPVGDPSIPGDGSIPTQATPYGMLAAVICYDMDTPSYMRQAGEAGVALVLAPSGDWRAITPWHPRIAKVRAVENGFALVRPASNGLLIAADQYGRTLGALDFFSTAEPVLVAQVPALHVPTIYTRIGDSFAWLCMAGLVLMVSWATMYRPRLPHLAPAAHPAA